MRELENCIARAVALGDHHTVDVEDLPPAIRAPQDSNIASGESSALSTTALADLERMTILRVFEKAGGDKALAGRMLGISRATLYRKLKLYNIPATRDAQTRRANGLVRKAPSAANPFRILGLRCIRETHLYHPETPARPYRP